jgi:hypothetical protein
MSDQTPAALPLIGGRQPLVKQIIRLGNIDHPHVGKWYAVDSDNSAFYLRHDGKWRDGINCETLDGLWPSAEAATSAVLAFANNQTPAAGLESEQSVLARYNLLIAALGCDASWTPEAIQRHARELYARPVFVMCSNCETMHNPRQDCRVCLANNERRAAEMQIESLEAELAVASHPPLGAWQDRPTLPGWSECRFLRNPPDFRVARWWNGKRLSSVPRDSDTPLNVGEYTDFVFLGCPTPPATEKGA